MAPLNPTVPPAPTFMRRQHGFTLTEMAVVMVIVALLVGGMILPMSAQQDIRAHAETQKLLADVTDALYGFAAGHAAGDGKPYLPCPDTDNDGIENRTGSACTSTFGTLPWATLGLGRQDAWGNALRYAITATYADSGTGFTLLSAGTLRVCAQSACSSVIASSLPAVLISRGKNGSTTSTDADELENTDGDNDFVQREPVSNGYDDVVVWLPGPILLNRMIAAGKLP